MGRPPDLLLPRWSPELASLLEAVALRQLVLPEVATHNRVAVLIHPVGEVLTGHADAGSLPTLKLSGVDIGPFLHAPPDQYTCAITTLVM